MKIATLSALLLALTVSIGGQAPKRYSPPRTPWGDPDLQGVWNDATSTPLQRPNGQKDVLTDEEAVDFQASLANDLTRDRRDGGADADVNRAYNDHWMDSRRLKITSDHRTWTKGVGYVAVPSFREGPFLPSFLSTKEAAYARSGVGSNCLLHRHATRGSRCRHQGSRHCPHWRSAWRRQRSRVQHEPGRRHRRERRVHSHHRGSGRAQPAGCADGALHRPQAAINDDHAFARRAKSGLLAGGRPAAARGSRRYWCG